MKKNAVNAPDSRVRKVNFPWVSVLVILLALTYLLLMTEPELASFYEVPAIWLQTELKYALLAVCILLLLRDLYRYLHQSAQQKADIKRLRNQVDELWQSKKQLQLKAHTYSGHADKLKLFISDKLLDYIEYDEKFLHFKSIAAEVRHNGVISFDKVQTALHQAALSAQLESQSASNDVQAALDAMRYLWDLLDLSTADNLALHIGNLLCECEEHYYQRMLNIEGAEPLPYNPVYSPQRAAWRALGLARHEPLPIPDEAADYLLDDGQWHVRLAPVSELLGNENHLVLLLENLLKNAQFFAGKRGYKSPFSPIALTLDEQQGQACVRVYNRGPHISDEDLPNLFQLGFSTRRAREHHGRGLGLYFVNEIVKGYEGRIVVRNIHTHGARYTIRLELEDGEVITELVDVLVNEDQPKCRVANSELADAREWAFSAPLRSVEVTTTGNQGSESTQRLSEFASKGKQTRFDPSHAERPQWQLNYQPRRNDCQISFEPLDISGVEFEIRLPTARQRLDNSELELDDNLDAEVQRLDERFRAQVEHDPKA
jgi:signal transduction histidine kinase